MDVLVADGTMNIGNGDGTFTNGTAVSLPSGGSILAVADFNGDGKPDLLEQGTGTLLVLLGKGDGTFQAAVTTTSGASLTAVTAVDLRGHGQSDVAGVFNGALLVYISKGDGTFLPSVSYNLGTSGSVLSVGDFNGDQKNDIVVSASGQEMVFLGNGDGTLQAAKTSTGIASPAYSAVGDFNGDTKTDLALDGYVFLGNGDGTFQTPTQVFAGGGPLAAVALNGGGALDLVEQTTSALMVYSGNGSGGFSNTANYLISSLNGLTFGDFNGDGKSDVAVGSEVLLGNDDGTLQGTWLTPSALVSTVIGDFEKTGKPGAATVTATTVLLFHNSGTALVPSHSYPIQGGGAAITTADLNGDGNLDLVVFGTDTSGNWNYSVLIGNGDGSFQSATYHPQSVPPNSGSYSVVVADFNNDRKLDIALTSGNQTVALLVGNGDGTFAAPTYWFDAGASQIFEGDFNSDGKLDILAGNGILYGNGDGTFQAEVFPSSLKTFSAQFTADLNSDGKPDLVSGAGQVALGNGDGTFFLLPPISSVNYGYFVNAVADTNGDGIPDLIGGFWQGDPRTASKTGVMLGNGDGTFGALIDVPSSGVLPIYGVFNSSVVFVADMDGDGRPDLVYFSNGLAVLLNTTQTGQPDFKISATAFSPTPVTEGIPATSTIVVSGLNGFSGDVVLSCPSVSGISCALSSTTISGGSGTSILTLTPGNVPASYPITVTGVSGSISHNATATLIVETSSSPDFQVSTTPASPATLVAGNSTTSTVSVTAVDGFSSGVSLACVAPGGDTCSLNPATVTPSGSSPSTSTLSISTSTGAAPGTQSVNVYATSGSSVYGTGIVLSISPDFTIDSASGSKTSQTVSAGQTANFSLVLATAPSFSGTANLACAITPVVSPAPTCALSNSSIMLSGGTSQTITVSLATTAAGTAAVWPLGDIPSGTLPLLWTVMLLGATCLWMRSRKRLAAVLAPTTVLLLASLMSCGGSGSPSSQHTVQGTPAGTYTATITATSQGVNHNTALTLVVQ